MIKTFDDLPEYIRNFLINWDDDLKNAEVFSEKKIPALHNKSIIEVINETDGEEIVVDFLNRSAGKFGVPFYIEKMRKMESVNL